MYESFFGLSERPFSTTPDPRFLYESRQHREALARLEYACEEREIALLTGEIGAGKTLLSRALMDRLSSEYRVVLLINPRLTPKELLAALCKHLDIPPARARSRMMDALHDHLYRLHEEGVALVLMLDEAQFVPTKSTFDEIRLLTNFQLDDTGLLSVILIGQPELRTRLERPAYRALAQRIGLRYHFVPLDREETGGYVRFRLSVAEARGELFDEAALDVLYEGSGGIPRLINRLAHASLIEAYGRESRRVTADIAQNALEDFLHHGQPPPGPPAEWQKNSARGKGARSARKGFLSSDAMEQEIRAKER
ncbi:MAG: AAA family ATPase [Gemmatimonadota bacterium]